MLFNESIDVSIRIGFAITLFAIVSLGVLYCILRAYISVLKQHIEYLHYEIYKLKNSMYSDEFMDTSEDK